MASPKSGTPSGKCMKFVYVDESGDKTQGDVFVMAGLLIDAYRLRKYTAEFDGMLRDFLSRHPGSPQELKTKRFINGDGGWSAVDHEDRKAFLSDIADLGTSCSRIYGVALSFVAFDGALEHPAEMPPFGTSHWVAAAMFVAALIQKKMQREPNNKGLTVLIFDDNKVDMPKVSARLYAADAWFDPLYQVKRSVRGSRKWVARKATDRFDHIINTAFATKSEHSSLVQVADAVAYIYRRHLELQTIPEEWVGEKAYYDGLATKLDAKRERLGQTPGGACVDLYAGATQAHWSL